MSFEPHDTALTLAIKKSQSACESQLQPFLYQVLKGGQQAKLKLQLNRRDINHFMRSIRFLNFWAYISYPAEILVYSVIIVYDTSNFIVRNQIVETIEHKRCKDYTFIQVIMPSLDY